MIAPYFVAPVLGAAIEVTAELGRDAVVRTSVNDLIETGFVDLSGDTTNRTQECKYKRYLRNKRTS